MPFPNHENRHHRYFRFDCLISQYTSHGHLPAFHEDRQPLTGEHYVTSWTIAEVKLSLSSAGTRLMFLWLFRVNCEPEQVSCVLLPKQMKMSLFVISHGVSPTIHIHSIGPNLESKCSYLSSAAQFLMRTWSYLKAMNSLSAVSNNKITIKTS